MDEVTEYLTEYNFLGVELWRFLALTGCIFFGYLFGKILMLIASIGAQRYREQREILSVFLTALSYPVTLLGLIIGIRVGLLFIPMVPAVYEIALVGLQVLAVITVGWLLYRLVEVPHHLYLRWAAKKKSKMTNMLAPVLRTSIRVAIVILTLVQIAQVLSDKPLTSIIAGLGIGSLAIALAAQDSLKHVFGSIVIFSDRPFEVGDRIIVDEHDGPVETVGFRSTQIRTLEGNLVTIPNGELVNKNILNISKRPNIRRIANLALPYDTPPEKVQQAKEIVLELLDNQEGISPDFLPRVYFSEFNKASLNLLVIYWYHPPDYWNYMEFTEHLNMKILRRFNEAGIDFALPAQRLHLASDSRRPLDIGLVPQTPAKGPDA